MEEKRARIELTQKQIELLLELIDKKEISERLEEESLDKQHSWWISTTRLKQALNRIR